MFSKDYIAIDAPCSRWLVVAGDAHYGVVGRLYLLSVAMYLDRLSNRNLTKPSRRILLGFTNRQDGEQFIDNVDMM